MQVDLGRRAVLMTEDSLDCAYRHALTIQHRRASMTQRVKAEVTNFCLPTQAEHNELSILVGTTLGALRLCEEHNIYSKLSPWILSIHEQ